MIDYIGDVPPERIIEDLETRLSNTFEEKEQAEEKVAELKKVLGALISGCNRCIPAWNNALILAQVHGKTYKDSEVSIKDELKAAETALGL
jgi:hypothetical protein